MFPLSSVIIAIVFSYLLEGRMTFGPLYCSFHIQLAYIFNQKGKRKLRVHSCCLSVNDQPS